MLNTCKCGGEVHLDYQQSDYTGQYWYAICNDCGTEYPLKADNRLDAVREWNGCKGVVEPLTEQEWLQTANTEQLADVLYNFFMARTLCHICPKIVNKECECCESWCDKKLVVEWLKQPHGKE